MAGTKPELLIPAGSPETLRVALRYGADAVYIGGGAYGLRAKAKNFGPEEMAEGIRFAHELGKKVHVTVNILAHDRDLAGVRSYLAWLRELGPDALLIADPGIFAMAAEVCPEIPRHISTQANNTNSATCRFWHGLGARRIVLARELTLAEIRGIRDAVPARLELETFVHGAMCMSYSGRCLLSNVLTGRDANRGACTHPCRWKYAVVEESRPGEYMPIEETERGTFLFHSKDLCMIEHIPDLLGAGIDSFKIEGRMKNALYVATVTRAYRRAIDDHFADPALYEENRPWYLREVASCESRPLFTGFYYGRPGAEGQIYEEKDGKAAQRADVTGQADVERSSGPSEQLQHSPVRATYIGCVRMIDAAGRAVIEQKNKFAVGDTLEVLKTDGRNLPVRVRALFDADGKPVPDAPHPKQELHLEPEAAGMEPGDVLRKTGAQTGREDC